MSDENKKIVTVKDLVNNDKVKSITSQTFKKQSKKKPEKTEVKDGE